MRSPLKAISISAVLLFFCSSVGAAPTAKEVQPKCLPSTSPGMPVAGDRSQTVVSLSPFIAQLKEVRTQLGSDARMLIDEANKGNIDVRDYLSCRVAYGSCQLAWKECLGAVRSAQGADYEKYQKQLAEWSAFKQMHPSDDCSHYHSDLISRHSDLRSRIVDLRSGIADPAPVPFPVAPFQDKYFSDIAFFNERFHRLTRKANPNAVGAPELPPVDYDGMFKQFESDKSFRSELVDAMSTLQLPNLDSIKSDTYIRATVSAQIDLLRSQIKSTESAVAMVLSSKNANADSIKDAKYLYSTIVEWSNNLLKSTKDALLSEDQSSSHVWTRDQYSLNAQLQDKRAEFDALVSKLDGHSTELEKSNDTNQHRFNLVVSLHFICESMETFPPETRKAVLQSLAPLTFMTLDQVQARIGQPPR